LIQTVVVVAAVAVVAAVEESCLTRLMELVGLQHLSKQIHLLMESESTKWLRFTLRYSYDTEYFCRQLQALYKNKHDFFYPEEKPDSSDISVTIYETIMSSQKPAI
jgi:hypothetical protein